MKQGLLAALLLALSGAVMAAGEDWRAKVDPALLAELAEHGEADFLAALAERADLSGAAALASRPAKTRFVFDALRAVADRTQPAVRTVLAQRGLAYQPFWIANAISAHGSEADVEAVARRPEVARVHLVKPQPFPGAPGGLEAADGGKAVVKGPEKSLALVKAPDVWALGFLGQGVIVADHDIGVRWDHAAIKNQYRGWDGAAADHRYNWHNAFDADPYCEDLAVPCDSHGHGTHTTGTMVGDDGKGNQVGMAPQARWIACRSLLDSVVGAGTVPTYLECMEWTLAPYPQGDEAAADPAQAPDVVNNSWGCVEACPFDLLRATNEAVKAAGIVQVASAGNDGSECSTVAFPLAMYESSFTVGSTTIQDAMSGFSSRGPVLTDASMRIKPDISAPGSSIRSSWNDGQYATISGTSMAAPHVSGLVALLMSAEPRLIGRVDDVIAIIQAGGVKIPTTQVCGGTGENDIPNNIFGHGRIDALAAVQGRPTLKLATRAPESATDGEAFAYAVTVSAPATARIAATGVRLSVQLPAGTALESASEPSAAAGQKLGFSRTRLAPGEAWTVTLRLRGAGAGAILSSAQADQVSPTAPQGATVPLAQGKGLLVGAWPLAGSLLLLALAMLRVRSASRAG